MPNNTDTEFGTDPHVCQHDDADEVVEHVLECHDCNQVVVELPDGLSITYDIDDYYEKFPERDPEIDVSDVGVTDDAADDMTLEEARDVLGMDEAEGGEE